MNSFEKERKNKNSSGELEIVESLKGHHSGKNYFEFKMNECTQMITMSGIYCFISIIFFVFSSLLILPLSITIHHLCDATKLRGKSLATLRERVERQRSVQSSVNHSSESNSLEGLNLERGDSGQKSRCVEQLDNQVSTLHKDVAVLSMEVSSIRFIIHVYHSIQFYE